MNTLPVLKHTKTKVCPAVFFYDHRNETVSNMEILYLSTIFSIMKMEIRGKLVKLAE